MEWQLLKLRRDCDAKMKEVSVEGATRRGAARIAKLPELLRTG
jgi:hypothetical protein